MLHGEPSRRLREIARANSLVPRLTPFIAALVVCSALFSADPGSREPATAASFSSERYRAHVEQLASPRLAGRMLGSRGARAAADYIETQFRQFGLEAPPGGFRQRFPVRLDLRVSPETSLNRLSIGGPSSEARLELHKDYVPLPFSRDAELNDARLVFAGYAIQAVDPAYDDFGDLDLRGAVVIALRREPKERDANSDFRGLDYLQESSFAAKAEAVARRGGKALLIVTNRLPGEEQDELPAFAKSAGPSTTQIPVLLVRARSLDPLFTELGRPLETLVRQIDETGSPATFAFPNTYRGKLKVKIPGRSAMGENVLGWLPGDSDEYVVVGAHFDHIGRGERFSMDNAGQGKVHPGADDNASGVAAMLEIARIAAGDRRRKRGILFAAFGGEEHGLFGSAHLLHRPVLEDLRCVGMLNFDMVGRLREDELFLAGLESAQGLDAVAERAATDSSLKVTRILDYPYNMSDHGTFLAAGIPSVLFFTGLHLEYHTSRDTADRIDTDGAIRVVKTAYTILQVFTNLDVPPRFVPGKNPAYERQFKEMATPSNPYDNE